MRFYIVDAFTKTLFGGNPAGVVILPAGSDFPPDALMARTAAELRYSETAFVKRTGPAAFSIRYFTPAAEVDLCGHATIGSFQALRAAGCIEDDATYTVRTLSGDICVTMRDGFILMDMAPPQEKGRIDAPDALEELYDVMGLSYTAQKRAGLALLPQLISTGLPDIILPVLSRADLAAIKPDFAALAALSERYGVIGVHAFTLDAAPGSGATCHTRNFAPLCGIDEEAATGTSSGALTYYGYRNGFVRSGDDCLFIQGEAMGRPSEIRTRLTCDPDGTCRIQVGGTGVVMAEGDIRI